MTEPTKPEPSEGARRAAREIANEQKKFDRGSFPLPVAEVAAIIDRETHSAEMRKALEKIAEGACKYALEGGCDDGCREIARAALKGGAL